MSTTDLIVGGVGVSRETWEKLRELERLVRDWQRVKNLVSSSTLDDIWRRHIEDSAQLHGLAPQSRAWLDLGSGSGFPGLVVAILGTRCRTVHLVESDRRKCAFLHFAAARLELNVIIHCGRIEQVLVSRPFNVDVVSARALADLSQLVNWSGDIIRAGAVGIFPKGQDVGVELAKASIYRDLDFSLSPSQTDRRARIVVVQARIPADRLRRST